MSGTRWWSLLVLAALIGAFAYDRLWGIRAVGLGLIANGFESIRTRSVSYGWRGRPPSGSLTGWPAVGFGSVVVALGLLLVVAPHRVEPLFCGRHGCT